MLTLLTLLWFGCIVEGNVPLFTYERFLGSNTVLPVHVEQMEKIKIYSKQWHIVTRIDTSFNDKECDHLRRVINNMSALCRLVNNADSYLHSMYSLSSGCMNSVVKLDNIVERMTNNFRELTMPTIQREKRQNVLDAANYLHKFNEILPKAFLMENDTTFIEGSATFFQNSTEKLEGQINTITRQINIIETALKQKTLNTQLTGARIKHFLQDLITYVTILILDSKINQEAIFNKLNTGKVIESEALLPSLQKLQEFIRPKNLRLPFDIEHAWTTKFYDVVFTYSLVIDKQVLIVHILPIIEPAEFTLYQLHAYPRKIQGTLFQLMLPEIERVALNIHLKKYFIMNDSDFRKCHANGNNTLLCKMMPPIISTEKSGSCAVDLLTKEELSVDCNYRIMTVDHGIWFKLQQNSWLFVFPKSEKVTVVCNGDVDNRFINGAGTLTIQPKCSIKTEHVEITASETEIWRMTKTVGVAVKTKINWTEIAVRSTHMPQHLVPTVIVNEASELLGKVSESIKTILMKTTKAKEDTITENQSRITHMGMVIYGVICVVVSAITCTILFISKKKCQRSRNNKSSINRKASYTSELDDSV